MAQHPVLTDVTARIAARSQDARAAYLDRVARMRGDGPARAHLSCGNQAHAYAAMGADQDALVQGRGPNIGIVTAYNDMLSAHQPFARFPDLIKSALAPVGATAQVAGGVPAMCDGVTQGQPGMELSLFSRDVIALAASVALTHNTFDAALFLGVCDKIVPGLVMAAAEFGHLPAVFLPAGPMPSGLPNDEKSRVRRDYAEGKVGRADLMAAEMASYHSPGTCTFYGTANSNQMLMEIMGLHLPGASFVSPDTPLRDALTAAGARRAAQITALGGGYVPAAAVLDIPNFVNGMVGLMATGGSTNLLLHLPAMARLAGVMLAPRDFADLAAVVPLIARVYPNGLADVNQFHAAGGLALVTAELLAAGLLHDDVQTVMGRGLSAYTAEPVLRDGQVVWTDGPTTSAEPGILRPVADPFQPTGGLAVLAGNLGQAVIKTSAVAEDHRVITAPARVFHDQEGVKKAFKDGDLQGDLVIVVRFQGPRANGMPELHGLTPVLTILQGRGQKVALVTDGRMSGASGKVPAAIHLSPEAAQGGPIALIRDGDIVHLDAASGVLEVRADLSGRAPAAAPQIDDLYGRRLFQLFRDHAGDAPGGASPLM